MGKTKVKVLQAKKPVKRKRKAPAKTAQLNLTVSKDDLTNKCTNDVPTANDTLLTTLPVLTRAKIDVKKAVELRKSGLTYADIAKYFDCARSSVHAALKKYGLITERVKVFRENRADILSELQERLLSSIDLASIKKSSMPARVLAVAQLYDKERLERDLSTSNVVTLHDDIAALKRDEADRKQKLLTKTTDPE